ncbi:efflux RND transporter periplasmic adaptor subunit [Marinobacter xestospongiae]|uniref:Efflux RND transporter periplasmic adaptor subunit n=2 Tax=Marinobacter xestospongiae TaxID=994319 RepID=A0ABU3VY58_9GAMM|nr:efflux RND transporter periplasmic adaptor subunit [Marinobacter xestospongiae]
MNVSTRVVILLVVAALAACTASEPPPEAPVSRPVKLMTVGNDVPSRTLRFPGSVSAVKQSDMAFEVSGRIVEMPVTEGERVAAGTLLARLDARDYVAGRDRARAERNAARADFNRYDQAYKANAVTAQQLDQARRALEVAEAGYQQASKAMDETVLRAPFAGRIADKLVEDFANVQAKQPVLVLQSDDALEMRVSVPEVDWVREAPVSSPATIELEGDLQVVLSSLPDRPMPATITAFSGAADPVTRTFEVKVRFHPPAGVSASPGMTGHVAYTPPAESNGNALLVPADAVVTTPDNRPFVWVYEDSTGAVTRRLIDIGELSGDRLHVLAGLEAGERIAVAGVHTLADGAAVRPMGD